MKQFPGTRIYRRVLLLPLYLLFILQSLNGQTGKVAGYVSDENNQPLPGVNVSVKGTSTGTITDEKGYYEIQVPGPGEVLVFSFVGYQNREVALGGRSEISVSLNLEISELSEVVVVGYGVQKKSDLTGSVGSVSAEQISRLPVAGVDRALQGQVSGVIVNANGGAPGAGTKVTIRGLGSIFSDSDPLYVVDGIPIAEDGDNNSSSIENMLNTADVASVEILKDAASTAIYGSRGANGVILITTKTGQKGKPVFSFESRTGIQQPVKSPEMAGPEEYLALIRKAYENDGSPLPPSNVARRYQPGEYDGPVTDWWNEIQRPEGGSMQSSNLSVSGGSETMHYYASYGYFNNSGFIKSSDYTRNTLKLNTDFKVFEPSEDGWISADAGININYSNVHLSPYGFESNPVEGGIITNVYRTPPIYDPFKSPELLLLTQGLGYDTTRAVNRYTDINIGSNMLRGLNTSQLQRKENVFFGKIFFQLNLFNDLNIRSELGKDYRIREINNFQERYYSSASSYREFSQLRNEQRFTNNWTLNNILTYTKSFENHDFSLMGAVTLEETYWFDHRTSKQYALSPVSEAQHYLTSANGEVIYSEGDADKARLLSYLGRFFYSYRNRYLITVNLRQDGSSKFASEYAWGFFPSISLGYKLSEERFFRALNLENVNMVKIRASYGRIGNQAIPSAAFISTLASFPRDFYYFGPDESRAVGIRPTNAANRTLHWETSESYNIGTDLAFLGNRLQITSDYYLRNTLDNLILETIPGNFGSPQPYMNTGEVLNKGLEASVAYMNYDRKLKYRVSGNISFYRNTVVSTGDQNEPLLPDVSSRIPGGGYASRTEAGSAIAEFYGYKTIGIFQTSEEVEKYTGSNGQPLQPHAVPGDFIFQNTNGDSIIDSNDKTWLGSPHPKFTAGLAAHVSYAGFSLDLFVQGQFGNMIFMMPKLDVYQGYNAQYNQVSGLLEKAWDGPGTSNEQPRISRLATYNWDFSDWYLSDGSYLRLKSLTLTYDLPSAWMQAVRMAGIKIYLSAENLFTFTRYEGLDPEIGYDEEDNQDLTIGYDRYSYPAMRSFSAGARISF